MLNLKRLPDARTAAVLAYVQMAGEALGSWLSVRTADGGSPGITFPCDLPGFLYIKITYEE